MVKKVRVIIDESHALWDRFVVYEDEQGVWWWLKTL